MNITRPPLSSLACINPECELYGQTGKDNLTVRKTYGADRIRYLRCRCCISEFSERKGSALWNVDQVHSGVHDKHPVVEEPDEPNGSRPVLQTSRVGDCPT